MINYSWLSVSITEFICSEKENMDEESIISIADSEISGVVLNETFSPPPKLEATPIKTRDSTINTTFTPEEKTGKIEPDFNSTFSPKPQAESTKTNNDTFSPKPGDALAVANETFSPEKVEIEAQETIKPISEVVVDKTINNEEIKESVEIKKQIKFLTPAKVTKTVHETPIGSARRSYRKTPLKPATAKTPVKPQSEKKFQLKSIRKRSFSVTDIDQLPKRVQFHSPANMEKTITEIDESLHLNFSKSLHMNNEKPSRRRQRSLSNAETPNDKLATIEMLEMPKKPVSPSPRRKMPNFAAIHQSIFNNMESLVDFKERTKERAQFLLNSADKKAEQRSNVLKPGKIIKIQAI